MKGKRVLLRVDCNVAVDEDGRPWAGAEQRLEAALPTISYLRERGARVVLLSHLGRPGGRVVESLRLDGVARRISAMLKAPVQYVHALGGPEVQGTIEQMADGDLIMLENLRFDPGEEAADPAFAKDLARQGDIFVQDAFGDAHREHASVALLPRLLPSYAGLLLEKEVSVLQGVLEHPARPAVAVVGGAKLETKLKLLEHLLTRVDHLLCGGEIANAFLSLSGQAAGSKAFGTRPTDDVLGLLEAFRGKLHLPTDVRVARGPWENKRAVVLSVGAVTTADAVFDIGPETAAAYCRIVSASKTCVWNGPLGKFELPAFAEGTRAVAQCVRSDATFSVVGGGDTVRAFTEMGIVRHFDHVSTGGGAMLAFLEGTPLPGIEPLYESL